VARFRPSAGDLALTLGSIALMHLEIPLNDKAEACLSGSIAIVLASLPVLTRRAAPVASYLAAFGLILAIIETVGIYNTLAFPTVLCGFALANRHGRVAAVVTAVATTPAVLGILQIFSAHPLLSWGTAQNLTLVALPLALGVAAHDRRAYTTVLVERAEAAERTREEEAERRVGQERLRIARDVHDVVAHAMVTINVQAGVGAHLVDRDPAQAHDTLRTIKQISGDALNDLRAMLGVLREDAPAGRPVQRLADVDDLRETLGAAGVDLSVDIDPAARTLPASVDATCYRIVQEALTNTVRHAGPTSARVRVTRAGDGPVRVEVVDEGGTAPGPLDGTGSGNGLRGMRERAAVLGGRLEAGPTPSGGWRVAATLPVGADGALAP
jgi:signal transduction histidine kinase